MRKTSSLLLEELTAPTTFFGKSFKESASHIEAEREHVASLVQSYREVATELRDTNDSLLSASQNEVMKTLTGHFLHHPSAYAHRLSLPNAWYS